MACIHLLGQYRRFTQAAEARSGGAHPLYGTLSRQRPKSERPEQRAYCIPGLAISFLSPAYTIV
jgi:hypothetical protein